jgi:hypothetical protein
MTSTATIVKLPSSGTLEGAKPTRPSLQDPNGPGFFIYCRNCLRIKNVALVPESERPATCPSDCRGCRAAVKPKGNTLKSAREKAEDRARDADVAPEGGRPERHCHYCGINKASTWMRVVDTDSQEAFHFCGACGSTKELHSDIEGTRPYHCPEKCTGCRRK